MSGDRMVTRYEFVVTGAASPMVVAAFEDFVVSSPEDGMLALVGTVPDESGLHGVLHRLQSLGLTIIEVRRLGDEVAPYPAK
ncbi:MAG: hypothetical protein WBG36_16320 [Ornithinimicrobium sp.]